MLNLATDTRISSLSGLETLLMNLNSTPICRGNTSFEDLMMNTTVFENSGDIAYVETGYYPIGQQFNWHMLCM